MIELPYTRKFSIDSYEIFVRVPNDYNDNTRDYPIIVLLDPNFLFTVLYGIKRVTDNNIIIGIGHKGLDFSHEKAQDLNYRSNVYRVRDFLPFSLDPEIFMKGTEPELKRDMIQLSGQANDFASIIKYKILPFIRDTFRVSNDSTLIGHSFGGVFTIFIYLLHPGIFQNYISISPVLDSRYYLQKEMFTDVEQSNLKSKIYCAFGSLEKDPREPSALQIAERNFCELMKNSHFKIEIIDGEDHTSIVPCAILRGLKFIEANC
jgi:predicted alpha/beta superfamily hydrolase